jgi:P-type Ca2+ transporter type 2C
MTSGVADTSRSGGPPAAGELAWHTLGADQVLHSEGVDGQRGLSSAEAAARAERFGPNVFAAGRAESRWHAFLRQYADPMQLVLLAAGIGSLYPLKQLGTGVLLVLLTLFNAVMGLQQEGKAAAAVAALQKMVIIKAKVRRDGQLAEIPRAGARERKRVGGRTAGSGIKLGGMVAKHETTCSTNQAALNFAYFG